MILGYIEESKTTTVEKKVYTINEEEYSELNASDDDLEASHKTQDSTGSEGSTEQEIKLIDSIQVKDLSLKIHKGEFV